MKDNSSAVIGAATILLLAGCKSEVGPANNRSSESGVQSCGAAPVRTDAMDNPEKHAWDLFLQLNHPARALKDGRGVPDCSKTFGAAGTTSVWETWRLARTEVFLDDGAEPPAWDDTSLPGAILGKTPDSEPSPHDPPAEPRRKGPNVFFDPVKDQGIFVDHGGIGETHVNQATYKFIKDNCLWSYDGLSRYANAVWKGRRPPITFPPESQEVKAVWVKFEPADVSSGKTRNYYTATANGITYGLVSLHVLTKDLPNWFWATFHQKDNPENPDEAPSKYPKPKEVSGTVWDNYVLGGTQTDFVNPYGRPTKLSDHYIEFGFTNSSCMTCHASAHGHPEPPRTPDGKLQRTAAGRIVAATQGPLQTTDIGVPDFTKFEKDDKPYFIQTDFVWSIPFRAREETKPPPQRCLAI